MDEQHPLPVRVGVNGGHVFSGDIGTADRRTFTVMGDMVDLAARLMAAAKPGDIYATATILDQSWTVRHSNTRAVLVKGKSNPASAYRVGPATGARSDPYGTLPSEAATRNWRPSWTASSRLTIEHAQTRSLTPSGYREGRDW